MKKYVLDTNGNPVEIYDQKEWNQFFMHGDRTLRKDIVNDITVSTVFLGVDHNFLGDGDPILWETCIFMNDDHSEVVERYDNKAAAEKGHLHWCEQVATRNLPKQNEWR